MANVIYGVLEEEKQRNLEMQEVYKKEIESLCKGSIMARKISGKKYYYLKYRDDGKVKQKYIGKDEEKIKSLEKEIKKRKKYEEILRRLKKEYRMICKIVKD